MTLTGIRRRRRWMPLAVLAVAVSGAVSSGAAVADAAGTAENAGLVTRDGAELYRQICAGCHMPDGKGAIGGGYYPALAGDRALKVKEFPVRVLLAGRRNMPAFGAKHAPGFFFAPIVLDHEQIAAVLNYVRSHFGNAFKDTITAADVARLDTQ